MATMAAAPSLFALLAFAGAVFGQEAFGRTQGKRVSLRDAAIKSVCDKARCTCLAVFDQ